MEGYIKDLGKTIPSMEGKWDNKKEYERLSIVYVEETNDNHGENQGDNDDEGGGNEQVAKYNVSVTNSQGAIIKINGEIVSSKKVNKGSNVIIVLSKEGYRDKTVTINNIQSDYSQNIEIEDSYKLSFILRPTSNINGVVIKAYNENDEELELSNGQITIEYNSYIKFVATHDDYNEKEIVYRNVVKQENPVFNFTNDDLKPSFKISKDGINWETVIRYPIIALGTYNFIFKRIDSTKPISLKTRNGYVTSGNAQGTYNIREENGVWKVTIRITSLGSGEFRFVGFEFVNNESGADDANGYVAVYFGKNV